MKELLLERSCLSIIQTFIFPLFPASPPSDHNWVSFRLPHQLLELLDGNGLELVNVVDGAVEELGVFKGPCEHVVDSHLGYWIEQPCGRMSVTLAELLRWWDGGLFYQVSVRSLFAGLGHSNLPEAEGWFEYYHSRKEDTYLCKSSDVSTRVLFPPYT